MSAENEEKQFFPLFQAPLRLFSFVKSDVELFFVFNKRKITVLKMWKKMCGKLKTMLKTLKMCERV